MDRFHRGLHFQASNSPKSSASPKPSYSGENNGNDIKQDQMDSKSQNSKKPFQKHFMSPTVSATSMVTVPRKKVLGEKNESKVPFDVQFQKSPSLESGSRSSLVNSVTSCCARSSAFSASNFTSPFNDEELNNSVADSSMKPYDRLTNYLSPRPQYLRYKPNRRRQILDRQQCLDIKEDGSFLELNSSFESKNIVDNIKSLNFVQDFLNPPLHEGTATGNSQETTRAKYDNGYDDEDEEEEEGEEEEEEETEEFEEKKRCSLKRVLQFFLLLVVMGLSTSYAPSVNSPGTSPMLLQGLHDGCYRVLNHSLESIPTNLCVGNCEIRCTQAGEARVGFSGVNQQNSNQEIGKVQMVVDDEDMVVESGNDIVRMLESINVQNSDFCLIGVGDTIRDHLSNVDTAGCKVDIEQVNFDLLRWDIAENIILDGEMDMIDDSSSQNLGVKGAKTNAAIGQEPDQMVQETMEKPESFADPQGSSGNSSEKDDVAELGKSLVTTKLEGNLMENAGEELKDSGLERTAGVAGTMENEAAILVEKVEGISAEKAGEEIVPEIVYDESSESSLMDYDNYEGTEGSSMPEEAWLKAKYMKFEPILTACIGFSIFAILLAYLVYINSVRAPSKASRPVKLHLEESDQKEKLIHEEIEFLQKKVESISLKPSTMFFSLEETRKDLSYNPASKVELLGELVIGKVRSSSKRCGRESKTNEAEESIKSVSNAKSSAHSVSQAQPSAMDTGSTNSPPYGSFTAEKKILKKQGARDGSAKIATTPVRRSSRLQNRSIISP